eukprot:GHVO01024119.1.p1 GENE.GHVO01024119.1~~GHVO01024119.1.p1  ORF type:complete len:126 (+),score=15.80 GHVO01024119.1:1-378(+)
MVHVGTVAIEEVNRWYEKAKVKRRTLVVRASTSDVHIDESTGLVTFSDLRIDSLGARVRSTAHSICRIVNQYNMRMVYRIEKGNGNRPAGPRPLDFAAILLSAASGEAAGFDIQTYRENDTLGFW